ncbi:MAG TPA: LysR family transcriptional regulator [Chthoniobacterales bacterium]
MTALEDLSLLRFFVRIVESGSISAAARSLKMPQPTLSRHLRRLEENCGASLLRRDTHTMNLTEAGSRLYKDAGAILELVESAAQRVREDQTTIRGHLRLFATVDFGQSAVTRLITRFLLANPGVTAELKYSNRLTRMIDEGFDAGVVVGKISDDRVVARPAGGVVRYLVAAPALAKKQGVATAPEDLEAWPWVSLGGGLFGDARKIVLSAPRKAGKELNIEPLLISEGVTSMREAVRGGAGVAVLPDWLVREDLIAGRLVRILPQWNAPDLPVHVIHPSDRTLPARVRACVDFAVRYMTTEMHSAT